MDTEKALVGFLVANLNAYEFSKETLKLIFSYLNYRTERVKTYKTFTSWRELLCGVPHISILRPILFNIYLNDLFFIFKRSRCL